MGTIRVSTPMRTWKKGTAVASTSTLDNVINLCKRRGFVFPCGEIYGGTRAAWDYGPFGVEDTEARPGGKECRSRASPYH